VTGVLAGFDVLDLSWGIAGPVAGMLLSDNGARVTKIEPPGGDPFRSLSGYRVWTAASAAPSSTSVTTWKGRTSSPSQRTPTW